MRLIVRGIALALAVSALSCPGARADDDQFVLAADHYSHQRWQQASDAFGKFLESHPDHARASQARFFYGEALAQLNQLEQARKQFAEVLRADPMGRYARQALFRGGEAAYLAGDTQAARRDLQTFCERFPDDPLCAYAMPYLASIELESNDARAAARAFSATLARYADGPLADECRLGYARANRQLGQADEARRAYETLAESNSALAEQAALELGVLENAAGNHQAALAAFERLEKRFPTSALRSKARLGRGYAFYKLGDYAQAEKALAELNDDPKLGVEAGYWLGLTQNAQKNLRQAAQTFSKAAAADEHHPLAPACAFHAADALVEDQQYAQAVEAFDRALARYPSGEWSDDCLFGKLRVASVRGEHDACLKLADALAEQFPDSPLRGPAEVAKGRSLLALGEHKEAAATLERVVAQGKAAPQLNDQQRAEARALLAQSYAGRGQLADATRVVSAMRGDDAAKSVVAVTTLQVAETAYASGDFDRARELFASLTKDRQAPAAAWSGLGWCYFRASQWKESAAAFRHVVDESPESPLAAEAALMCGRSLERLEQYDDALAMYQIERYASGNQAAESLWRAAVLYEKQQQPDRALALYARLIERHADFSELDAAIYRRARLLVSAQDNEQADTLFEQLRVRFPTSRYAPEATLQLAERALAENRYDKADELIKQIGRPADSDGVVERALYLAARVAFARQDWDAVDASVAQLKEQFPKSSLTGSAAYLAAEATFRRGDYTQAVERLSALSDGQKAEPWSATAELHRAQALAQLKEWTEAADVARQIGARFPDFDRQDEVDYLIGRCLAARADFSGARDYYRKAIESPRASGSETAAMAQWMMGETFFHQQDYRAALTEYERVDDRYAFPRWRAAALLQAAKCQELLGQWRAAADSYDRVLNAYPDCEFAAEATRRRAAVQDRLAAETPKLK
jgi:cellulose synthase operon protein C